MVVVFAVNDRNVFNPDKRELDQFINKDKGGRTSLQHCVLIPLHTPVAFMTLWVAVERSSSSYGHSNIQERYGGGGDSTLDN